MDYAVFSDERLARLFAPGDAAAFEALVCRHSRPLFNFACRLVGDYDSATEVAQDTFVRLYAMLPGRKADLPLRPLIYRMARNRAIDILRERKVLAFSALSTTALGGSTFTVNGREEGSPKTRTVLVNDLTKYLPARANLSLQNVVGVRVRVSGFLNSSGNLVASHVRIASTRAAGVVKSVQDNAIVVQRTVDGQTRTTTVVVGDKTRYLEGKEMGSLADVKEGSRLSVVGYRDRGDRLNAVVAHIRPASSGAGS